MTREDILRMAREAGVPEYDDDDCEDGTRFEAGIYALERFAELVAAAERIACLRHYDVAIRNAVLAEREACAKIVEDWPGWHEDIATEIRARGSSVNSPQD